MKERQALVEDTSRIKIVPLYYLLRILTSTRPMLSLSNLDLKLHCDFNLYGFDRQL